MLLYRISRFRKVVAYVPVGVSYAVLLIAILVAVALLVNRQQTTHPVPLLAQTVSEGSTRATLQEALDYFIEHSNSRSRFRAGNPTEGARWLKINIPNEYISDTYVVKFESLQISDGQFWVINPNDRHSLTFEPVAATWRNIRNGISVEIPKSFDHSISIIGRITSETFNRPGISIIPKSELSASEFRFERTGGVLLGSLAMLAAFSFLIATLNRDKTFLLFGAWILTSLRVAAQNGGWDISWLGLSLNIETQRAFLRITLVSYYLISLGLFDSIFKKEVIKLRLENQVRWVIVFASIAPVFSWILFPSQSLYVMWLCGFSAIVMMAHWMTRILRKFPTSVAYWSALAWGIGAAGVVGEIVFASGSLVPLRFVLNSQVSALASALIMAISLAARMREERSARISAQRSAINALQRFRENYHATPVGLFSMKEDGTITEYNPAFGTMFNLPPPSQYKQKILWSEVANEHALEFVLRQAEEGRLTDTEIALSSREGGRRWLHMRALRRRDRIETWIEDITARKEAEGRLQFLANHDSLTGLLNRRGFNVHLERAVSRCKENDVCIAYVDLDRFKLVNDLFGHVAGDQVLRQMATRTRSVIRPPHLAARVGGDEFVLIIHDLDLAAAKQLCEELCRVLGERPYQHQDKAFTVAASIGLIKLDPAMNPRDALTASDRACSEAKRLGGSSVVALEAQSSQLTSYLDEIKLVANMRERLPVENFFTQLQPIVSLRTPYSSLCYEVLVRMHDGMGNVVAPGRFIAAAERNGLMSHIDRWVLRSTLEWLDENPEHREKVGFCTVNLSGASLNDEKFLQDTIATIRDHPDATQRICFEVTESVALYDLNTTRRFVDKVKSFGARVALDDFGAGYTSFNYLKELPGDFVKIDGSFIRDVNLNPANHAITRAIVDLSHEIGMACVAEWAENADIIRTLMKLNVDYAQGFALSRPVDRERMLHANSGMDFVIDAPVISVIGQNTLLFRRPPLIGGRRSILSV